MSIQFAEMYMNNTRRIYEGNPDNLFVSLTQKIAVYSLFPIALIAAFEGMVKNLILINLMNCSIAIINKGHELIRLLATTLLAHS